MLCCILQSRFSKTRVYTPTSRLSLHYSLPVLRSHEVGHGLWLAGKVVHAISICVVAVVVVTVTVILRSNVLELVYAAALWASLNWAVAGSRQPDDIVGVNRETGAAEVLLVAEGLDSDGVVESSCTKQPRLDI